MGVILAEKEKMVCVGKSDSKSRLAILLGKYLSGSIATLCCVCEILVQNTLVVVRADVPGPCTSCLVVGDELQYKQPIECAEAIYASFHIRWWSVGGLKLLLSLLAVGYLRSPRGRGPTHLDQRNHSRCPPAQDLPDTAALGNSRRGGSR